MKQHNQIPQPYRQFGKRIRRRRRALGLSEAQLAARVGLNVRHLAAFEEGQVPVRISHLQDFAKALDVHPSFFLDEALSPPNDEQRR